MKALKLLSVALLSATVSLSAAVNVTAKAGTWQMAGFGVDTNLSKNEYLNPDDYTFLWYWDNGNWKAYSANSTLKQLIVDAGFYGESLKANQAFWIKAVNDIEIPKYMPAIEKYPSTQGWHMVSYGYGFWDFDTLLNKSNARTIFAYRDNAWDYRHKYDTNNLVGNLRNSSYGEGIWVFNSAETILDNMYYSYYGQNIITNYLNLYVFQSHSDTFANKKFSTDDFYIILDQNGIVLSDDDRFNGGSWIGRHWQRYGTFNNIQFRIINEGYEYTISMNTSGESVYNSQNGYYEWINTGINLNTIFQRNVTMKDSGVKVENFKDTLTYTGKIVTITDTTTATMNTSVISQLDLLKNLLTTQTQNAKSVLNAIKLNLSGINSDDAKVALAIVNFIEILDEDIVKTILNFDGNSFSMDSMISSSLFPDTFENLIDFNQALSNYNTSAKTLLGTFAIRLKNSSDILEAVYSNPNFVFEYDGATLNYADTKIVRAYMMALASKLQLLSSYDYGSNTWLKPITENNIEYINAAVDPVGFLNSKEFFVSPDNTSLQSAKAYMKEFLTIYDELLSTEYHKREGVAINASDIDGINMKFHIKQALKNINGEIGSFTLIDDWTEYNWNNSSQTGSMEYMNERFEINLNSLFDSSTAITINDFPTFKYLGSIDLAKSKIMNEPTDINGNFVDVDFNVKPTAVNNINNFFKSFKDDQDVTFEGTTLLGKLFN